jgi:GNAT superfamily N-acetyltransferase
MSDVCLRPAQLDDIDTIFALICALAEYEQLAHAVTGFADALGPQLFGSNPTAEVVLADVEGKPAGFALFFATHLSRQGLAGLYLEDLFVQPNYRGGGVGKAVFTHLAQLALERGYQQLEWSVLDWNAPAIAFYQRIGATLHPELRQYRLTGSGLTSLAQVDGYAMARLPAIADRDALQALARMGLDSKELGSNPSDDPFDLPLVTSPESPNLLLVEREERVAGFAAGHGSFSTFLTQPGYFLRDFFVSPQDRRQRLGTALLAGWAKLAVANQRGRLEWQVLAEDTQAIAFSNAVGAVSLSEWIWCRLSESGLNALAQGEWV